MEDQLEEAEAKEQHNSIIEVLKAVALGWIIERINCIIGNHKSIICDVRNRNCGSEVAMQLLSQAREASFTIRVKRFSLIT